MSKELNLIMTANGRFNLYKKMLEFFYSNISGPRICKAEKNHDWSNIIRDENSPYKWLSNQDIKEFNLFESQSSYTPSGKFISTYRYADDIKCTEEELKELEENGIVFSTDPHLVQPAKIEYDADKEEVKAGYDLGDLE